MRADFNFTSPAGTSAVPNLWAHTGDHDTQTEASHGLAQRAHSETFRGVVTVPRSPCRVHTVIHIDAKGCAHNQVQRIPHAHEVPRLVFRKCPRALADDWPKVLLFLASCKRRHTRDQHRQQNGGGRCERAKRGAQAAGQLRCTQTHPPTHPRTHPRTHAPTHPPTHPRTHPPTHTHTHTHTHTPTHPQTRHMAQRAELQRTCQATNGISGEVLVTFKHALRTASNTIALGDERCSQRQRAVRTSRQTSRSPPGDTSRPPWMIPNRFWCSLRLWPAMQRSIHRSVR
jgi:hypothetical protein